MSTIVWLCTNTLTWPQGGGNTWLYLNWALGLRALGCQMIWLEPIEAQIPVSEAQALANSLRRRLEPYGLGDSVALCSKTAEPLRPGATEGYIDAEAASEADLLLNLSYAACAQHMWRFRRTAMLDIDPGLTQVWLSEGAMSLPRHDVYFTVGETVGRPEARFPNGGLDWQYTPPCVALDWWPVCGATNDAPFTTISNWDNPEWFTYGEESYNNNKRAGFEPFLGLPRHSTQPLELALCQEADEHLYLTADEADERKALESRGWRVVHSHAAAPTPWHYQRYIQKSRGEFSCAKPSYVRLQTAWISDRTLCYLASGKPAVTQHTGPSRFLPDAEGLFRFRDLCEAARSLETATADYTRQSRLARALTEEYFCARKVAGRLLERALA
jgi:hypothetical protein